MGAAARLYSKNGCSNAPHKTRAFVQTAVPLRHQAAELHGAFSSWTWPFLGWHGFFLWTGSNEKISWPV
eukprot:1161190-Pelagomonas_calceolata.AAC.2